MNCIPFTGEHEGSSGEGSVPDRFLIKLLSVNPYPEDGVIIDADAYVVTMVVDRMGPVPVASRTWGAIKALFRP